METSAPTAGAGPEGNSCRTAADANDTSVRLQLTGEQTIRTAGELHEALAHNLERGLDMVVDLSGVDVCDAAALQLIFATHHSAVQQNQLFRIEAVSPAVADTAAALGLDIAALTRGPAVR